MGSDSIDLQGGCLGGCASLVFGIDANPEYLGLSPIAPFHRKDACEF